MGCVKSKHRAAARHANSTDRADGKKGRGERAALVQSLTGTADDDPPSGRVDPVLLEYAQRLSEEIVHRAVQQWVEVDSRYSDIPYIECDVP